MIIVSNTNAKTWHFHKLSATFPLKFYQFLPVFDFLMLTNQVQVSKTCLPSDATPPPHQKKSLGL